LNNGLAQLPGAQVTLATPDVCRLFDVTYVDSNIQERSLGEVETTL
jgi:hypothetical protein